ncbi:MAG: patatin-like phospholipase family protein [Allosphingosinicella sp.]
MPKGALPSSPAKIALALSGGGSRAMAFHLGCLRALRDAGLLEKVTTISSVSGGSVLAALYCHTPGSFDDFEVKARRILARGFLRPAIGKALTTSEGISALFFFSVITIERLTARIVALALRILRIKARLRWRWLKQSLIPRRASRTTILGRVFSSLFDSACLPALRADRPKLIVVACELQTKSAFYFAADGVSSWRFGDASPAKIEIADAVSASAAYPIALPALDREFEFTAKDGSTSTERVILTDGGVYDNLGLAPLWPDRDAAISFHVDRYSRIIACRAGYALEAAPAPSLATTRVAAAFESIFARAQNFAVKRLFDLKAMGQLDDFLHPYLGQADHRFAYPPPDLIRCEEVAGYPTDFSAMPEEWIDKLVKRGEQVTHALLAEHWSAFMTEAGEGPVKAGSRSRHGDA